MGVRRDRRAAAVLLVFAGLIALTLTANTVLDLFEGLDISFPVLVGTIIPSLVGLIFAGTYLRGLQSEHR